jgi:hypothetical protein
MDGLHGDGGDGMTKRLVFLLAAIRGDSRFVPPSSRQGEEESRILANKRE